MDLTGLFISIAIGVGIVSYFEGRRVGRNQGIKKGITIGFEAGVFVGRNDVELFQKVEVMKDLRAEVH